MQCEQKPSLHLMQTPSHFPLSRPRLADSSLCKININHQVTIFDLKASQCTFFFSFKKNTVNQTDKSVRAAVGISCSLCYSSSQARFLSFYLSRLISIKNNLQNKHSATFKHTSPYLFTSKHQSSTTNRKWNPPNPHIWGMNSFHLWKLK